MNGISAQPPPATVAATEPQALVPASAAGGPGAEHQLLLGGQAQGQVLGMGQGYAACRWHETPRH